MAVGRIPGPLGAGVRGRRTPGPGIRRYEEFRQKTVQHFESTAQQVANHCSGRNAAVAEVLCYLSLLRNAGAIPNNATVSSAGAGFQSFRGSSDTPAAHCLPCQILINDKDPSTLVANPRTALTLKSLFGKCTLLPLAFNHADSAAEGSGLIEAFVWACEKVIRWPVNAATRINREIVRGVYNDVWCPQARQAYAAAIAQKRSTAALLPQVERGVGLEYGMIGLEKLEQQWESVTDEQVHVHEVIWILGKYSESLAIKPTTLLDAKMSEIERQF